ncbi:hypothetical protein NH26_20895 [Flammeovirga pacifica]|uniref:Uncharacterized protein n=1 Tax=Flammeovirga pacifica TaxID=915059 RepID=A0A1S1YST0_FLAPC|nr:hypothetical protein NH26_20895 [Flammeovirga pacifica]
MEETAIDLCIAFFCFGSKLFEKRITLERKEIYNSFVIGGFNLKIWKILLKKMGRIIILPI